MLREDALELVRQLKDARGHRDVARVMDLYADEAVALSPVFGEVRGRAAIGATWRTLFDTFSDITLDVSDVLVDGDRVAVLSTVRTTDRIGWFGLPATGAPITYRLVFLWTMAGGKIVRDERIHDSTGVLERLEKARLDKELRMAGDEQRALLSRHALTSRFCTSMGDSVPCRAIGGDFFEFVDLPSGDLGVVIGDVAGKGPAAALLAAMLQGMLAVETTAAARPATIVTRMNQHLFARHIESRFATLVYGVLSPNGTLTYSNAGHNPPILVAHAGIRRLHAGGPILGAFAGATFGEETLRLNGGDTFVMFTDGVTEARNERDEEFGEPRLLACLRQIDGSEPDAVVKRVFDEVRAFCQDAEQTDDITVTATRFVSESST